MVRVCVVGCGTLGLKVAGALSYFGHSVRVWDRDRAALDSAHERLRLDRCELRRDGLLLQRAGAGRVTLLARLDEALADARIVFECVSEDAAVKEETFARLSAAAAETAILASCTLRVPISALAARVQRPERVLGVRFLYPVYYVPEVEVTPGPATSRHTMDTVTQFLTHMGLTPFLRCGPEPVVLDDEQREQRRRWRRQRLAAAAAGAASTETRYAPQLAFVGNLVSAADVAPAGGGAHDCAVCMDAPRDCVMAPCHHLCTCCRCARLLRGRRDACPICRQPIQDFIRVYMS
ncbi:5-formyl-3-hydroxy-2-methylpyridine 4-carboxylate 5-dehydrogenase-like [Amphibalanus amphitrite]|uniref:5-formyl-3-hydroxy-2-methylpyridine 4-carboxylate 5-dehydrogenase-like n=1 Tax=Amphibalanus amphitrite TaxID=1232801 RepID=UPI001C91A99A|nr:5-formyl-3-hydroxy-2-methylpyridine 4-carboxylate 5-dehydrogenase-like [Amphibalanus amphitrite]